MIREKYRHTTYGVRFALIEAYLLHHKSMPTQSLADLLGCHIGQAHRVLREYRGINPRGIEYLRQPHTQGWVPKSGFRLKVLRSDADPKRFLKCYKELIGVEL